MASGETLLKITDIPFAYTILTIIFGVMGVSFSGANIAILVGAAGTLGTFLAITDPIGRLLKFWLKRNFKAKKENEGKEHSVNAVNTTSIGIEIDKIVSLSYLFIILAIFATVLNEFPAFTENLILTNEQNEIICDESCITGLGVFGAIIGEIFIGIVGIKNWKDLKKYAKTAGIHHIGISSEFVTNVTIENISRAIERNDWATAEEWAKIVEIEIKTEKGMKDFNIEAVNQVYRPLYEESIQNDVAAKNILDNNVNTTFSSKEWDHIQSVTRNVMIKNQNLINKINLLYEKIKNYNRFPPTLENQIQSIIRKEATQFYGIPVDDVQYYFKTKGSGSSPALWDCLRSKKHPLERNTRPYDSRVIELRTSDKSSKELKDPEAIEQFDKLWDILLEKVENEINLSKLDEQVKEIQNLNDELKPIFEEQIKKQWL